MSLAGFGFPLGPASLGLPNMKRVRIFDTCVWEVPSDMAGTLAFVVVQAIGGVGGINYGGGAGEVIGQWLTLQPGQKVACTLGKTTSSTSSFGSYITALGAASNGVGGGQIITQGAVSIATGTTPTFVMHGAVMAPGRLMVWHDGFRLGGGGGGSASYYPAGYMEFGAGLGGGASSIYGKGGEKNTTGGNPATAYGAGGGMATTSGSNLGGRPLIEIFYMTRNTP